MRQGVWMVMVAVATGALAGVARAQPPTDVLQYAVFGIQRTSVGARARVDGDVGSLVEGLTIGHAARVSGVAAAPTVTLRRRGRATGGYFCGTLSGSTEPCMALPTPLIPPPTIVIATPGTIIVSAPKGTGDTGPLPAGSYGRLYVHRAAVLTLAGGSYQFASINVATRAGLTCSTACDITVQKKVVLGQSARFGAGDGVKASDVVVSIAGQGESTALASKNRTTVRGMIYAPSATVQLGPAARTVGAIVGNVVTVGPRARCKDPGQG